MSFPNPATGEKIPSVPDTDPKTLSAVFERARAAQKEWAKKSFAERARALRKMKYWLADHAEEGAEIISQNNGKTRVDAMGAEIVPGLMCMDWYFSNAADILKPRVLPTGNILFTNKVNTLHHLPLGVVGIISPWNYPFAIPFAEILMGLMAGNAVLLKVASNVTPVGDFIARCVKAAEGPDGFPPGLFEHLVLPGRTAGPMLLGETGGEHHPRSQRVDKLFFTGSVPVGKALVRASAMHLVPLSLELGGKDPMIVMPDADLERASNCACWAGYQNAGQSCGGVERVYVHDAVWDAFLALMIKKTRALSHGPDTGPIGRVDIGAVTTKGQLDVIKAQVDAAVRAGGKIVAESSPVGDCSKGWFFPATLMVDVTHEMSVMTEETFGPVIPLIRFSDTEDAIRLANDCTMALTSSVFTRDRANGRRIALATEAGVTCVNDHLYTHGQTETPWGGWKDSGLGRTHGSLGLLEMTQAKCVNDDWLPLPRNLWWYPLCGRTMGTFRSMVRFVAPRTLFEYLGAVAGLLPFAVQKMFTGWNPSARPDRK